jgi:hypothetical protein
MDPENKVVWEGYLEPKIEGCISLKFMFQDIGKCG